MASLVVMLPCLNEAQNLPGLFSSLEGVAASIEPETELTVLVVDDGSSDGTAQAASDYNGPLNIRLVQHPENRGLGAALLTGITWFNNEYGHSAYSALAVMDADGTHPPELLVEMLKSDADVVIASRYAPGGEEHGLSGLRRMYSKSASTILSIISGVRGARDYTCGYRLYRGTIMSNGLAGFENRLITETGFVCMAELLIKLARCGATISEVPLKLHYELKGGPSKMNVPATIRRYVALGFKVLFSPAWRPGV